MSVIWSGVTEEGAVVPVQVTAEGKVVAVGDGPEGDYLPITGGELTGDLTVNEQIELKTDGSASFAGSATFGGNITTSGRFQADRSASGDGTYRSAVNGVVKHITYADGTTRIGSNGDAQSDPNITLNASGNATFAGTISSKSYFTSDRDTAGKSLYSGNLNGVESINIVADGSIYAGNNSGSGAAAPGGVRIQLNAGDGSVSFADDACGFTSSGELFFTSRGTRYKLFVSQNLVQAEEYTRQMELKEKADKFIENKVEPRQDEVTPDNDNA